MTHALALIAEVLARPPEPRSREKEGFQSYETDKHRRNPPPGIPFGYVLEVTTTSCQCGRQTEASRLFQCLAAGFGTKMQTVGGSSPVFDRPIRRMNKYERTPICLACVEDLRPAPVDYPAPGPLHTYKGETGPAAPPSAGGKVTVRKAGDGPGPTPKKPTSAASVVSDFL